MEHISNVFKAIEKNKVADIKNLKEILKLPSPLNPLYLQIKFKPRSNIYSQKFAMVGGCFGSLLTEPPKGIEDQGAKPTAAGGWGFGDKAYSRLRHGGLGAEPQCSKILHFFAKIT